MKSELLYFWTAQPLELTPAAPESMKGLVPVVMVLGTDGTPQAVDRARTALDSSGVTATPAACHLGCPTAIIPPTHPWPVSAGLPRHVRCCGHCRALTRRRHSLGHPGPATSTWVDEAYGYATSRPEADHCPGSSLPAPQRAGPLHRARFSHRLAHGHRHQRHLPRVLAGTRILRRPRLQPPLLACCAVLATFGFARGNTAITATRCRVTH